MSAEDDFKIWNSSQPRVAGQLDRRGATLKVGARVCKTATICEYGDSQTGAVSRRELRVSTSPRMKSSNKFDFANPQQTWSCENEEINILAAFLNNDVLQPGAYRLVESGSAVALIADILDRDDIDASALAEGLAKHQASSDLLRAIASTNAGQVAAATAVRRRRQQLVSELHSLATRVGATEADLQPKIHEAHWLFGGRYVGTVRRDLIKLDQHDIVLIDADGTLHIVELKGPDIPGLVRKHRNHWIVGNAVHEAVSQAMNYLRALDEQGSVLETTYRNELGEHWDMRRVRATVLIGHPTHVVDQDASRRIVEQTIRSYNAHLSRVEVMTYQSLLEAAERALRFEEQ